MRNTFRFLVLALLLVGLPLLAAAQVARGTILGTVKDESGAVIPGVSVTIVQEDTG